MLDLSKNSTWAWTSLRGAKEKDNVSRLTNSTFLRSNALGVMEADAGRCRRYDHYLHRNTLRI